MNRADQAADLLAELMHSRDRTELARVLGAALDPYSLACLVAVARTRLGDPRRSGARQAAISAGLVRPRNG